MAFKIIFLFIIIAGFSWCYNNIDLNKFTKENITEQIKKEKTINAVQSERARRYNEAQDALNSY